MDANKRDYLFVDGAYLRDILRDFTRELFSADPPEIDWRVLSSDSMASDFNSFLRTFYYDCPPKEVNCENPDDRDTALAAFDSKMDVIGRTDGFHVFRGVIAGKRRQRQKKVDVKIAVDMLMHTLSGTMDSATLLAGDQDFVPVIESLVRAGMYVRVMYEKSSASKDLLQSADEAIEITPKRMLSWCSPDFRERHRLPGKADLIASDITQRIDSLDPLTSYDWRCTAVTPGGQNVRVIFIRNTEQWAVCYENPGDMETVYSHKDPAVLARFLTMCSLDFKPTDTHREYDARFNA